jgi:CDP-glycerol glycerophosphotransferase
VIVRAATARELIGAELPPEQVALLQSRNRKLLVVPTWQRGVPLHVSTPAFHRQLERWATANDGVVFVKSHPFLLKQDVPADVPGKVIFLDASVDVYPWMAKFDGLITDYSSIMFDFLLTHRPIFTFNSQTQVAYGFEPDYSLIPEGRFRYEFNADDFETIVAKNLADHPLQSEQRKLSAQLFETPPADACGQLLQLIRDAAAQVVDKNFTLIRPVKPDQLRVAV